VQLSSVTEVFATWLETNTNRINAENEAVLLTELNGIVESAICTVIDRKTPNGNFNHTLGYAAVKTSTKSYDEAIEIYSVAIQQSGAFSAFAHYGRAFCYVNLLLCDQLEPTVFRSHLSSAISDLKDAKNKLVVYKKELLSTHLFVFMARRSKNFFSLFANAMRKRCVLIDYVEKTIDAELELLGDTSESFKLDREVVQNTVKKAILHQALELRLLLTKTCGKQYAS
jgi:hypothetical protein